MEKISNDIEKENGIPTPGPSPISIEREGLSDVPIIEENISEEDAEKLKKLLEEEG